MIPVTEFVQLEAEAREAYKQNDYETIARVNNRLAEINTSIYWNGDEAFLITHNPGEVLLPEEPPARIPPFRIGKGLWTP